MVQVKLEKSKILQKHKNQIKLHLFFSLYFTVCDMVTTDTVSYLCFSVILILFF